MNLNPIVCEIAAHAFWRCVKATDFKTTSNYALNKQYDEIWNFTNLKELVESLNLSINHDYEETLKLLYNKANDFIYTKTSQEQNIDGIVYADDAEFCKAPYFEEHQTLSKLKKIYEHTNINSNSLHNIEKQGVLIVRSPLPSVIYVCDNESPTYIQVENTKNALGFHVELFFEKKQVQQLPPNPFGFNYCLSGIFMFKEEQNNDFLWQQIIPNSIFYNNLSFLEDQTEQKLIKDASELFNQLYTISKQLYELEKSLLPKLDEYDKDAHTILKMSMNTAKKEFQEIGYKLHNLAGFELMQMMYNDIPIEFGNKSLISLSWHTIGDWQH